MLDEEADRVAAAVTEKPAAPLKNRRYAELDEVTGTLNATVEGERLFYGRLLLLGRIVQAMGDDHLTIRQAWNLEAKLGLEDRPDIDALRQMVAFGDAEDEGGLPGRGHDA